MGNNQSNTRTTNNKVFRVSRTEKHSGWYRCYLDDYVSYNNGDEKRIDFKDESTLRTTRFFLGAISSVSMPETPILKKGDYIRINMDYTKEYSSGHEFSVDSIEKVGFEIIDSDGNTSIMSATRELGEEILGARQRYAEQAEYSRWLAQTEAWTSYNLPPK